MMGKRNSQTSLGFDKKTIEFLKQEKKKKNEKKDTMKHLIEKTKKYDDEIRKKNKQIPKKKVIEKENIGTKGNSKKKYMKQTNKSISINKPLTREDF